MTNLGKVNNVIALSQTPLGNDFFKYWFIFLRPLHHLTDREIDIISALTRHRYELSKKISDDKILDNVLMGEDIKKQIAEECGITIAHYQVILGKLRKNKVVIGNSINPKLIPNIRENEGTLQLLVLFPIK